MEKDNSRSLGCLENRPWWDLQKVYVTKSMDYESFDNYFIKKLISKWYYVENHELIYLFFSNWNYVWLLDKDGLKFFKNAKGLLMVEALIQKPLGLQNSLGFF